MSSSAQIPKTVFILGAGASKEAGLPTGHELKKIIAKALDIEVDRGNQAYRGDQQIYQALRLEASKTPSHKGMIQAFQQACWHIRDAMPQTISIDNFIDVHSEDKNIELCGKLAIVRTILDAEARSTLFVDPTQGKRQLNHGGIEGTWFNGFFKRLTENCKPSGLPERLSSVVLIIFNYDRCIEQYLYYALQNFYRSLNASEVGTLLRRVEIYHPYGTVGSIPWLRRDDAIEYGATPSTEQLLKLTSQIKTFTEGTDQAVSDVAAIRLHMKNSLRLVFLGFAFHRLNNELLLPSASSTSPPSGRSVFATAYDISNSNAAAISAELAARGVLSAKDIQIRNDLTCSRLFEEYSRSMSFV